MMTPERWKKVRDVLERALEVAPEKRSRFLDVVCSSDHTLRSEVQSFLSADDRAPSDFLESPAQRSTTLAAGTMLGDYEIVSPLGAGGMGVVYQAQDLRLGRAVAIKVLPANLSADVHRLRRFEQEAQSAASLNHPHILGVYRLGTHQGAPYMVSELLEGETLREELKRGVLGQSRAMGLGEQIADGLSAAHQRGIIHRDLKPENLYVTTESRVKILDFGLAKLVEEERDSEGSMTAPGLRTHPGMIAGTVVYMSPEQVRSEKLDARTDVFSLGVVLYEMATGKRPFEEESLGLTFEAILNGQPAPPRKLNARITPEFERIINKALEKDREVRYQSAAEIRADLKRLKRDIDSGGSASYKDVIRSEGVGIPAAGRLAKFSGLALLCLIAIAVIWLGYSRTHSGVSQTPTGYAESVHAQIDPPPQSAFRLTGDNAGPPVISPSGAYLAYAALGEEGKVQLWVRPLSSVDARALPDTAGATFPFWSPDSNSLGFFAEGKLKTINVTMGSAVSVCEAPDGRGGTWSAQGEILFTSTPTSPLLRVKATGGSPQPVTKVDQEKHTTHRWPFFLPDQKHFLYFAANHNSSLAPNNTVHYASLDGAEDRPLFPSETNSVFADGYVFYGAGDNLMARAFDSKTGQVTGEAVLVARRVINDPVTWHVDVSASDNGTLLYGGVGPGPRQLVWLDRTTYAQTEIAVDGLSRLFAARLSPEGDRIILQKSNEGYDTSVYDLRDKITLATLPKPFRNQFCIWSAEGKWIAYTSPRDGRYNIYRMPAGGNGSEQLLFSDDKIVLLRDWKGGNLLYLRGELGNPFECWILSLKDGQKRRLLEKVDDARLSPDAQWLAYSARESLPGEKSPGSLNVYVMGMGNQQGKYEVSEKSGLGPQWSPDGKELYYLEESTLRFVAVKVTLTDGSPRFEVINKNSPLMLSEPLFAVSPDKKRILIERIPAPTVVVITNFAEELKRK